MSIISSQGYLGDTMPVLGTFSMPTKTFGDAPFTITPPSSTLTTSWTYTSSDSGIISIAGSTATVVAAGSCTVTATQPWSPLNGQGQASANCTVQPPASDPYFANVALLCHFDGNLTDQKGNVATNHSMAYFSSGAKFSQSLNMDGTARYATFPYTTALTNWAQSDFTIEMWINHQLAKGTATQPIQVGHMTATGGSDYWSFGIGSTGRVVWFYFNGTTNALAGATTVAVGSGWRHIAMTKQGTTLRVFLDGVLDGTATMNGTPQYNAAVPLTIGGFSNGYAQDYLDDLRITSGVARYTSNFTVTSSPFPNQ